MLATLMHENYYFPVINKPTCFSDSSATAIDHIWTNLHSHQIKSGAILDPLSDHLPVYISIDFTKHNLSNPKQKRFFTPQNLTKFNEMLKNIDITPVLTEDNTNCAYELLMSNYKKAFSQCFPLTQQHCKTKNNQAWFDKDLYLLMVNKNKFFKKYLKKKNVLNKANFNKIRNSYNRALQEKNKALWHKLL